MSVIEWTVKQILKDSECCGNPLRCNSEYLNGRKEFYSCAGIIEEDVEVD